MDSGTNWLTILLYIIIGIFVTGFIFVKCLDGADSISQLFDNAWHLSIIRKFVDTGNYSTVTSGDVVATVGSKFYPTGWHSLVALVISMTGVSIGVSENAVVFLICAIVFPVSMFALFETIFVGQKKIIVTAALAPLMFAAFPWRYITFGPLYSNLLSFAVTPLAMALLIKILDASTDFRNKISLGIVFIVSIIGVAMAQPNAVFTLGVLIAPFLFYQIPKYFNMTSLTTPKKHSGILIIYAVVTALIIGIWFFLYKASFMQRTVTWGWPSFESKTQSLIDILFLGFRSAEPQIGLGLLVFVGIVYTLFRRQYLWISISYGIVCSLYALSASTDGPAKNVLTGFWYHDSYRLGASAVFFGAALAGLGIFSCMVMCNHFFDYLSAWSISRKDRQLLCALVSVVIYVINFFPSYSMPGRYDVTTAFGAIRRDITYWNSANEPKSYDDQEHEFVEKVKGIIPEKAVILNQPYDGSAYAYGLDGLNVYYKAWEGNWMGKPTKNNYLISTELDDIATNVKVQKAVRDTGARYLILLDRSDYKTDESDSSKMSSMYASYIKSSWKGIDAVDDKTSGFTKILEHGDMRLYRIDI